MSKTAINSLCLFSLVCFSKLRETLINNSNCDEYDYLKGKLSLNCDERSQLALYKDFDIHTIAINGTPKEDQSTLANVNFNHLIIQSARFKRPGQSQLPSDISKPVNLTHHSLTIVRSSSVAAWSWSHFHFKHVHFEDCQFNSDDGITQQKVVSSQFLPSTLISLSMINCRIYSIGPAALSFLKSIQMLTITYNHLNSFTRLSLPVEAPDLWSINLSNNQLESLADSFTANLPSLKELNLRNNRLLNLPSDFFVPSFKATLIILADNPLNCTTFCQMSKNLSPTHTTLIDLSQCFQGEVKVPVILTWTVLQDICSHIFEVETATKLIQYNNH